MTTEVERCWLVVAGQQCAAPARFWVGASGADAISVDDFVHVCGDHVEAVKRDVDTVHKLGPAHAA